MTDNRYIIVNLKDVKLIAEHLPVHKNTGHILHRFKEETGADILEIVGLLKMNPNCYANKIGRRLNRLLNRANYIEENVSKHNINSAGDSLLVSIAPKKHKEPEEHINVRMVKEQTPSMVTLTTYKAKLDTK